MTATVFGSPTPPKLANTSSVPTFPQPAGVYTDPTGAIIIPAGWGNKTWWAYRQARGAARGDVIGIGDSTMYGSGGFYSYLQRLRDDASGASTGGPAGFGMADGGKGMFGGGEGLGITYDAPEINGVVSGNFGGGFPDLFDNLDGAYFFDTGSPAGHTQVLQFRQSAFRLWYSARASAGQFTYSIDGGAPVTVNAFRNVPATNRYIYVSGLAPNTTHTLTITNLGGLPPDPPVIHAVNVAGSGSLTAGTYYYVATYKFGGGETAGSAPVSVVVPAGGKTVTVQVPDVGQGAGNINIYRGTSSGGPFGFMSSTTTGPSGGYYAFNDDGSITPSGSTNPPVTGTTNLNTSSPNCYVALAPENATGIVFQNFATSGDTINNRFFGSLGSAPFTQPGGGLYQTPFGLVPTTVNSPAYSGAPVDSTYAGAAKINPVLGLFDLGFNDLSSVTGSSDLPMWTEYVKRCAGVCADAGCDGVIISGQLPFNANWPTYGAARFNAMKTQALASGLAFVDLLYPVAGPALSYSGGTTNPHLTKAQYQAQADFLWNNLLGLTT